MRNGPAGQAPTALVARADEPAGRARADSPPLRAAAKYGGAVAGILRQRLRPIVAYAILMWLFDLTRAWTVDWSTAPSADVLATTIVLNILLVTVCVVAPALVEAAGPRGWRRIGATIAVLAGSVVAVLVAIDFASTGPLSTGVAQGLVQSNLAFLLRMGWIHAVAGLLFAVFCHLRDQELTMIHAARTATLERAGTERDIVEMRLKVMQARVEPEILFGALADVRAAYANDPHAADALLDDLIAYLRAALPEMRRGTSTVLREARLAEAYLRVLPAGRDGRLVTEVSIDDAAGDAAFPPLVLLPLVHAAAEAGAPVMRITARRAGETPRAHEIELAIETATRPARWSDDALDSVRAIVSQCFGPSAGLTVTTAGGRAAARISWSTEGPARRS